MTATQDRRRVDDGAFRQLLERNAIWNRMVTVGDRLPIKPLIEVDLGPIHLDRLLHTGPLVLAFIRYASSPECEAALLDYRTSLAPALRALDAHLVAVSPQRPERLAAVKHRHDLDFLVAADPRACPDRRTQHRLRRTGRGHRPGHPAIRAAVRFDRRRRSKRGGAARRGTPGLVHADRRGPRHRRGRQAEHLGPVVTPTRLAPCERRLAVLPGACDGGRRGPADSRPSRIRRRRRASRECR